jgi:hypothetical protein
VIENARVLELPLNGRQVTDLIVLSGAAVQTPTSTAERKMPGAVDMSVAGGLSTSVVFSLDGALHNDPYGNDNMPLPFPDALQEFKVETSALSAQYGMYSGAWVNSVTKSGTNGFHGDLFEFLRNDLFNARNYFATTNSTLKRNQYGGTIGGPIKRNRLFFFGGYQGTTVRQDPANTQAFIPTAAMLSGDFTAFASPACNSGRTLTLRAPFVNNRIDPAGFSKAALFITDKLPKTSDPCGRITYGTRIVTDDWQGVGKIDYQRSDKDSIFGRLVITRFEQPVPYTLDPDKNLLNTRVLGFDDLAQSYAIGDTYLFGPNTINSFRLGVNRVAQQRVAPQFFNAPFTGIKATSATPATMSLNITGGFTLGAGYGPNRTTTYQASDDLSLIRGTHQWALGVNLAHWRNNLTVHAADAGQYTFNGQVTGSGLADFLTGNMSQLRQIGPANITNMSQWYFGAYIADSWRVTPRLTFNYGARWEPFFPQVVRHGIISNFSEERFKAGTKSTVFKNAPVGFYYPGDPGFPGTNCRPSGVCSATGMVRKWWDITPRIGLAWDPMGDGRMSIRSSYGMAYDLLTGGFYNNFVSAPWTTSVTITSPAGGFDDPWRTYPGGNPFPPKPVSSNVDFAPFGSYFSIPYDNAHTSRHSWNLSVQRQFGTDWLVSSTYLGSHSVNLWVSQAVNPAIYIPGNCAAGQFGLTAAGACSTTVNINFRRRLALQYPNIGGSTLSFVDEPKPGGTQTYNGLLLSVQRRAVSGVTVSANYTWSHCYGDGSKANQIGLPGNTGLDPNNRDYDRGNCDGDRRQIFNMTAVAQTPQFGNPTLRAIATGWRLSGIYKRSTGSYLTVTSGVDRELSGVSNQRASQVLGSPYGDKSITNFLNPAAFALPPVGALGNLRPRNIAGPAIWQFDVALSRTFRLTENQKLEARAEAYNVTNSLRPGDPVTVLNNSIFGQINTSGDPRILQFALKYVF